MIELCDQIRRGNILMAKPTKGLVDCYLEVTGIGVFSVTCAETEPPYPISEDPYNKIRPVLLTEEILTKVCGFEDNVLGHISYYVENNGELVFRKMSLDILYDKPIEFLHDFQNLYQDLTGEKLKIKFSSL